MNTSNLLTFVGTAIAGYLTYLATRGKNNVDLTNAKVGGEKSSSELFRDYGIDMDARFEKLQAKFDALSDKFDFLKEEKEILATATLEKDKRIKDLEKRVDDLEKELARYHEIENKMTEAVHAVNTDILKQ